MSLPEFLESGGYRRVQLTRNGVGHFEAAGTLAGRSVRVLIDTGAASTVVSLALAQELGLRYTSLGRMGGLSSPRRRAEAGRGDATAQGVFERQSAVIDYGSSSLFLRDA
jgi:hypothetical protein